MGVLAVCLAQPLRSDYRQSPSTMTPSHVRSRELELEPEHPAEAEQAHQVSHSTGGDAGSTGEEPLVGEGEMENHWRWDLRLGLELLTVSLHLQMALRSSLKMIANASEGVPIVVAVLTGEPLVRGGTV